MENINGKGSKNPRRNPGQESSKGGILTIVQVKWKEGGPTSVNFGHLEKTSWVGKSGDSEHQEELEDEEDIGCVNLAKCEVVVAKSVLVRNGWGYGDWSTRSAQVLPAPVLTVDVFVVTIG